MIKRKKLFSSVNDEKRIKLFSNKENLTNRLSLFSEDNQRAFSLVPENELEKNLKLYSGKSLSNAEIEKIFSIPSEQLKEEGYAVSDDLDRSNSNILETALLQSKMFAKLRVITIKELDLDPIEDKESVINNDLETKLGLPKKAVMVIRKAHCLPEKQLTFSDINNWIVDSKIENDLKSEFGGGTLDLEDFNKIIENRYNDAPENIIEVLEDRGTVSIDGEKITIN